MYLTFFSLGEKHGTYTVQEQRLSHSNRQNIASFKHYRMMEVALTSETLYLYSLVIQLCHKLSDLSSLKEIFMVEWMGPNAK
jgi:hypothetical protein